MALRVGLLGFGDAGRHHARALQSCPEVQWTAVATRNPPADVPAGVDIVTPDQLLGGGLCDAVIIATPDGLHAQHACRAFASGHHVLVEKPVALSLRDAQAVVDAARDRVLQVGYHLRHHPGHELAHARMAELVGTPRSIHVRWAWLDKAVDGWRANGRDARWWSLAALGTHGIDLALWLVGREVEDVAAVRTPPAGIDHAAEVVLRFAGGTLGHVSVAITHGARSALVVTGDRGELVAIGTLGARGAGEITHHTRESSTPLAFTPDDPYVRQLRAFARRCAGDGLAHDRDVLTNLRLLESISS